MAPDTWSARRSALARSRTASWYSGADDDSDEDVRQKLNVQASESLEAQRVVILTAAFEAILRKAQNRQTIETANDARRVSQLSRAANKLVINKNVRLQLLKAAAAIIQRREPVTLRTIRLWRWLASGTSHGVEFVSGQQRHSSCNEQSKLQHRCDSEPRQHACSDSNG